MVLRATVFPLFAIYWLFFARLRPKKRPFRLLVELPLGQSSQKWEKLILDSSQTCMRSFMPLSFSAAEKFVTVQTNKQKHSKLSIPSILPYDGIKIQTHIQT